jgi:alpha/beta superfamily hydrolase
MYGGDMDNNVVVAICRALVGHSIAAFRFNFRGVGGSEGSFGAGTGEQQDVEAALTFVRSLPEIDSDGLGLAGYSFGGRIALEVASRDERVKSLALVSPALHDNDWKLLEGYSRQLLVIVGDSDIVVPLEAFQRHAKRITADKRYKVVSGADHFWRGHEREVSSLAADFFVSGFAPAD